MKYMIQMTHSGDTMPKVIGYFNTKAEAVAEIKARKADMKNGGIEHKTTVGSAYGFYLNNQLLMTLEILKF